MKKSESIAQKVKMIKKFRGNKPVFRREESWRYKRIETGWRKPKGIDSKMRLKKKGRPTSPTAGFRVPKSIRGLHPSGLSEVLVHRVEGLKRLDAESQTVRIARGVGGRKRAEIIKEAEKLGLKVLNPSLPKKAQSIKEKSQSEEEASP
jgi:large subunit ribosomal protein L32e|nr:50S ribosomal protein L32e [Candidatus Hecatella orcuttiae]